VTAKRDSGESFAFKHAKVAALVRAQVADGLLLPGESAPSGAALARITGYSALTCRKGLRALVKEGVLVPGASEDARLRVPMPLSAPVERNRADAVRALSASLAARRRAAGLTQPRLAGVIGVSVTTVGHAETGRVWQSRDFWERADKALTAGGELLALHDAYRAADLPAAPATAAESAKTETTTDAPETTAVVASGAVACVTITWADGTATTVYPPPRPVMVAHPGPDGTES
jgi:DNA-binding XRE family transcriptional regulator